MRGGKVKEVIVRLTSDRIKIKGGEYVRDLVRCVECKYFIDNLTEDDTDEAYDSCRWDWSRKIPTADDFCSYGEREGE